MAISDGQLFLVGYDGYLGSVLSEKEVTLTSENSTIFKAYKHSQGRELISLTPSLYKELTVKSVYQYI
jgi:4-hydroxy 2-oxovalerate aldolase